MKPVPPPSPSCFTDRKASRTDPTCLKPGDSPHLNSFFLTVLLSLFIPSSILPLLFNSFFLPSFIYLLIFIFVKILSSFLSSDLFYSFFLPFIFYSFFLPPFSFSLFHPVPTGETIKPGALKRPVLHPNGGHPNNQDSETDFTLLYQRTCKVGAVNTSRPAGRGNPPTKEPPTDNNGR